ncbi:hypothetical protein [Demequina rhizosphaerae]|uniref:hypothetical protein n=1 Tax=Demequina rhizosphaerae TaxID=1638985 RepID=UPI000782DD47|nr:hypothetical protein [Demequina rhizosphaerae]
MAHEIQLISDGIGLAIIGDPAAVDAFLTSAGMTSRALDGRRLTQMVGGMSAGPRVGSDVAESGGRWVKLTEVPAQVLDRYGLRAEGTSEEPTGALAGVMAQLALEQAMDEISEYLAGTGARIDDVLRAQPDTAVAGMIRAQAVIEEALTHRAGAGGIPEATLSTAQGTSLVIAYAQAYALRQFRALADKFEDAGTSDDRAAAAEQAASAAQEWLAVVARSLQLQDSLQVLELDRVLDSALEELDHYLEHLRFARSERLEDLSKVGTRLVERIDAAIAATRDEDLPDSAPSRTVIESRDRVAVAVRAFHDGLGIEGGHEALDALR